VEVRPPAWVDASDAAHDAGALPRAHARARRLAVSDIDVVGGAWG